MVHDGQWNLIMIFISNVPFFLLLFFFHSTTRSLAKTLFEIFLKNKTNLPGRTLKNSIVLQSLIYFNVLFSFVYIIIQLFVSIHKVITFKRYKEEPAEGLDLAFFCLWVFVEPIRLYNGYKGNLHEKVSMLATFLLLTFLPQSGVMLYLITSEMAMPFTIISNAILLAFGVLQSAFGYFTLNRLFVHNRANFAFSVSSIESKKTGNSNNNSEDTRRSNNSGNRAKKRK